MSDLFTLSAEKRSEIGKGASRRLRRLEGKIPAILYGGTEAPLNLTIAEKDILKALENEAFYSHVITLEIEGNSAKAILKDLQRHPAKSSLYHADFQRVDDNTIVHIHVPIHFINQDTCIGVKQEAGSISHSLTDVEIQCPASKLPEYLEVDMKDVHAGSIVHLSDIPLPEGVKIPALAQGSDHDLAVATVNAPKGGSSEEGEEEGGE